MLDPRPRRHPREERAHARVGQSRRRPVDKCAMDVMPRDRSGEGVQPGGRRAVLHRAGLTEKRRAGQRIKERRSPPSRGQEHRFYAELTVVRLRSEEHTSELQSLMRISYAVFCLKKKKTQ